MPTEITKLRERAKRLGYRLHRRGIEYSLVPMGDGNTIGTGNIDDVPKQLDMIEGKVAIQFYTPCGTPIEGMNNAEAVAEYKTKQQDSTMPRINDPRSRAERAAGQSIKKTKLISPPTHHNDREQFWADRINAGWQKATESIIETGQDLLRAKTELSGGTRFEIMVADRLRFSMRTAERLMEIARNPVLTDPTHVSALPASWGTLYELTRLPPKTVLARIADGTINPKMERKDVAQLKPGAAKAKHEAQMTPILKLKQEKDELERVNADLKEELTHVQRDLQTLPLLDIFARETPEAIAHMIILEAGNDKAKQIAEAILQRLSDEK